MSLVRSLGRHLRSGALAEGRSPRTAASSTASPPSCTSMASGGSTSRSTPSIRRFQAITRWGKRQGDGRHRGGQGGLHIKLNMVALKG